MSECSRALAAHMVARCSDACCPQAVPSHCPADPCRADRSPTIPSSWTCTLSACPHPCSMNPHTRCRGALQRAHTGPVARLATLGSLAQRSAKTVSILSNAPKESCRSLDGKTPARARTASEMMPACSGRMMERRTPRPGRRSRP